MDTINQSFKATFSVSRLDIFLLVLIIILSLAIFYVVAKYILQWKLKRVLGFAGEIINDKNVDDYDYKSDLVIKHALKRKRAKRRWDLFSMDASLILLTSMLVSFGISIFVIDLLVTKGMISVNYSGHTEKVVTSRKKNSPTNNVREKNKPTVPKKSVYAGDYISPVEKYMDNNVSKNVDDWPPVEVFLPEKEGYRLGETSTVNFKFWDLPRKTKFGRKGERIRPLNKHQKNEILSSPYRLSIIQKVYNIALKKTLDPEKSITVVAQVLQESLADTLAVSSSGAKGACQFMDGTAIRMKVKNVWDIESCVPALIRYNDINQVALRKKGRELASNILMAYNAGLGGANSILTYGKGKREARQYAAMIQRWQDFLLENNLLILYTLEPLKYASR